MGSIRFHTLNQTGRGLAEAPVGRGLVLVKKASDGCRMAMTTQGSPKPIPLYKELYLTSCASKYQGYQYIVPVGPRLPSQLPGVLGKRLQ